MFRARGAKQVTTWRSKASLRTICLRGCSAKHLAFHHLISMIEKLEKHPLPQSFLGQAAFLVRRKIWLIGKYFKCIKTCELCTRFSVQNVFLWSLWKSKAGWKIFLLTDYYHQTWHLLWSVFCVDCGVVFLRGHWFCTRNPEAAIQSELQSWAFYSSLLKGPTVHFDKHTIVVESRQEETRES